MSRSLRSILVRQAEQVFSYEGAVLDGPGVETVHDMRVSARRLRAVLKIFRKAFDGPMLPMMKEQVAMLSGLIRTLGKVRDCDIMVRNLEGLGHLLVGESRVTLDELIWRQRVQRDAHAAILRETVRRLHATAAKGTFLAFVKESMPTGEDPGPSLREAAGPVLGELLRETASYRREVVGHPGRIEVLHSMRIESRPLRYVMEAFQPAFGKAFSRCLKELKDFLDVAGEIHDCDVMIEMLSGQIGKAADRAGSVRIAKLLAAQRAARRTLFRDFREAYQSLGRGKFRKKLLRSIE
jgi:CHAD domain-containing protein